MNDRNESGGDSKSNPGAFNLTAESFKAEVAELPSEDEAVASAGTEATAETKTRC